MLSGKDPILLYIKENEKYHICIMDLIDHFRQVCDTGRLLIWRLSVCTPSFNGLKSPLLKKCFSDLKLYKPVKSSGLVVQLKLK